MLTFNQFIAALVVYCMFVAISFQRITTFYPEKPIQYVGYVVGAMMFFYCSLLLFILVFVPMVKG